MIARDCKIVSATLPVFIFLLPGCAVIPAKLNLAYRPDAAQKSPLTTLAPMNVAFQVQDQRPPDERDRVGDKRNGYGMRMAKILSNRPPTSVLNDALSLELGNNGHTSAEAPTDSDAIIRVDLQKYWTDVRVHWTDLEMIATLCADVDIVDPQDQSTVFRKPFACAFRESTLMVSDGAYERALNGVLREFVRDFARDPGLLDALGNLQPRR